VHEGKRRTIIRDKRFEEEMRRLLGTVKRADEFLEGAETILAGEPTCGIQLNDSSVWFVSGHTVDVVIYYAFDDDHVYLLSAQRYIPPEL